MADNIPVEGNLDLKGNQIKNVAIEVVTTLPTTNLFVGRRVTFNNKDYIWNGTEWESNRNWLSVYIATTTTPYMYAKLFTVNNPFQNIELNLRPYVYYSGNPSLVNYLISFAYNRVVINKLSSNPAPNSGNFHYNLHIKKLTVSRFEIYVGMPTSSAYRNHLYADITNIRNGIVSSVELFQTLDTSDTNVWTSLLYDDQYFTEFHSLKTNKLKVNGASISDETINYDTNNIEPTQAGTVTKTSTWLWQYLVQSINFLWLKLKDLFPTTQATTHNYLPKINNSLKKLVKSNINDDGTTPKYGANTIWHSGNDGSDSGLDADLLDSKHADDFAQLEDGKIKTTNLPDYLLGQVIYGGSINSSQTCTLSSLYKDKFDTTDPTKLLSNLNASSHVGVYFIASGSFMLNGTIDVQTGDWVISDGNGWGKIDNTDAVASVNGQTGVVNLGYEDLGGMPKATDTEVGGIVLGFVPELDADLLDGKHASEFATSSQGAKADTALQSIDKTMVENVLTGFITSHDHNYTTYKIFDDSNGVFDANNIFEDVSYYVLNSTNKLNSASLPDELYGDGSVDNSILSPFWFDSSIIKDNNNINQIKQRIVRSGSSVTDSVDNRQNVISKCYIRVTRGLGAWTPWQRVLTSYDEYNGQSNWNQTDPSQRNYIQNKPDIITINNGVNNNESLDDITTTGVYPLIYGRLYGNTPNPACGTLSERNDLEGFLFVYKKDDIVSQQLSQQLHDTINNIFYIRSFDSYNNNWNYWEKIITCKASYGEQGNSPEVTSEGFNLEEQEMPVNTFYNIDTYTPGFTKNLTINIYLDNVDNYLRNNGPAIGEFKITLMFSDPIVNPTLNFYVSSPSFVSTTYLTNGTNPSGLSDISGLEIMIKWYENEIIGGFLFSVYKVNIL